MQTCFFLIISLLFVSCSGLFGTATCSYLYLNQNNLEVLLLTCLAVAGIAAWEFMAIVARFSIIYLYFSNRRPVLGAVQIFILTLMFWLFNLEFAAIIDFISSGYN